MQKVILAVEEFQVKRDKGEPFKSVFQGTTEQNKLITINCE